MQLTTFQLFCYQGNARTIIGLKIIFPSIFINCFNFSQGCADKIMPTVANSLSIFFVNTFGCISQSVTLTVILLKTEEWSKKSALDRMSVWPAVGVHKMFSPLHRDFFNHVPLCPYPLTEWRCFISQNVVTYLLQ